MGGVWRPWPGRGANGRGRPKARKPGISVDAGTGHEGVSVEAERIYREQAEVEERRASATAIGADRP